MRENERTRDRTIARLLDGQAVFAVFPLRTRVAVDPTVYSRIGGLVGPTTGRQSDELAEHPLARKAAAYRCDISSADEPSSIARSTCATPTGSTASGSQCRRSIVSIGGPSTRAPCREFSAAVSTLLQPFLLPGTVGHDGQ